jgi:uncharacterized phosphosugar-binding protein
MNQNNFLKGVRQYYEAIQNLQKQVIESQVEVLDQVAGKMVEVISGSGRIFIFGTGHSHMIAEEAFFRAGGLAAAVPVLMTDLMLHENPHLSSRLERTPGIAQILVEQYRMRAGEMLFVYSNSGVNQMPVEMALVAKEQGLTVVGVSSRAYAQVAPLSSVGKRLDEVVDYAIDNLGLPGDGLVSLEGSEWRVGPSSTIIGAMIWNSLIVEVIQRLHARDGKPPVYASFNMSGAEEQNRGLLKKWGALNPHLKGWMDDEV